MISFENNKLLGNDWAHKITLPDILERSLKCLFEITTKI